MGKVADMLTIDIERRQAAGAGFAARIDVIILGGTELPLILTGDAIDGVPLVDTTAVHVREIGEELAR